MFHCFPFEGPGLIIWVECFSRRFKMCWKARVLAFFTLTYREYILVFVEQGCWQIRWFRGWDIFWENLNQFIHTEKEMWQTYFCKYTVCLSPIVSVYKNRWRSFSAEGFKRRKTFVTGLSVVYGSIGLMWKEQFVRSTIISLPPEIYFQVCLTQNATKWKYLWLEISLTHIQFALNVFQS